MTVRIALVYIRENCDKCFACEEAFYLSTGLTDKQHPGVRELAKTFDYFDATEWKNLAVPVYAAVRACKHEALLVQDIEENGDATTT